MRFWKPTRHSLFGLLGAPAAGNAGASQECAEVQDAVLRGLGRTGAVRFPKLVQRVLAARDAQSLWYLRGEVMYALALLHGETLAADMVEEITAQLETFGFFSRPSPLGKY